MFNSSILKPINQCKYTGIEKRLYTQYKNVQFYEDTNKNIRIVTLEDDRRPVTGLLLEFLSKRKGYRIKGVYTVPSMRRLGLAKCTFLVAKHILGDIRHSDNLTKDGELWMRAVEGLK